MEIYQLLRLKEGGKDHQRLPKVLSDLTLDKLILKEAILESTVVFKSSLGYYTCSTKH